MTNKKVFKLKEERNLKHKSIRLLKRKEHSDEQVEYRELNLSFGTIWTMEDKSVPFDNKRKESEYKDSKRPVLVLNTPKSFFDYSIVSVAPGTSKVHINTKIRPVLDVITKNGRQSIKTYYLLYFKWNSVQKKLYKKVSTLQQEQLNRLNNLMKKV